MVEKQKKAEPPKKQKKKELTKLKSYKILGIVWCSVLAVMTVLFFVTHFGESVFKQSTYYLLNIVVAFASFVATSFFGLSIYYHNSSIRDQNNAIRNQTTAVNKRAEAFRNLQFVASNYTIIDFFDTMQIYEEYPSYVQKLKEARSFLFYLLEKGISKEDVLENTDSYQFITLKLPMEFVEGKKTIGKLRILSFKFDKEESIHRFVTPGSEPSQALILYNEAEHRSEAVVNLIMKKGSDFFKADGLNPFKKIKIRIEIESMLGVIVCGAIELYFTNPEKIDQSGISRYKINSSQFELYGMPKLAIDKEYDLGD